MDYSVISEIQKLFRCHGLKSVDLFFFLLLILTSFDVDMMPLLSTNGVICETALDFNFVVVDQCFSNFKVYANQIGIFLKYRC